MNKASTLHARIPHKVKAGLEKLAEATNRPVAWHVGRALSDYVQLALWQVRAINKGMREAEAGHLIPHAEVVAWIDSWGTENELPMPKWKPRARSSRRRAR